LRRRNPFPFWGTVARITCAVLTQCVSCAKVAVPFWDCCVTGRPGGYPWRRQSTMIGSLHNVAFGLGSPSSYQQATRRVSITAPGETKENTKTIHQMSRAHPMLLKVPQLVKAEGGSFISALESASVQSDRVLDSVVALAPQEEICAGQEQIHATSRKPSNMMLELASSNIINDSGVEVSPPGVSRELWTTTTTSNHSHSPSDDGSSCHDDEQPDDDGSGDEDEHDEFDGESSNPTLQRDGEVFSWGSSQHPGACIPCAFYCFKRRGCEKDKDCQFCHMAHFSKQRLRRDEWKRRQHEKRRRSRALAKTFTRPSTQPFGSGGTISKAAESGAVVSAPLVSDLPLRSLPAAESSEACFVRYPHLRGVPSASLSRDRPLPRGRCVATITQTWSDRPPVSNGGSVVDSRAGSTAGGGNKSVAGRLGFLAPALSAPCAVLNGHRSRRPAGSNSIGSLASGSVTQSLCSFAPPSAESSVCADSNATDGGCGASSTQVCESTFRLPCPSTGSAGGASFCGSPNGFLVEVMNVRPDEPCFLSIAGPDVPQPAAPLVAGASGAPTGSHLTELRQFWPQCLEQLHERVALPGQPLRRSDLFRDGAELQSILWRI